LFEHDLLGKPVPSLPDHALDLGVQKGSPAKRTGQTLRIAAQYSQKTPKNNGLLVGWLIDFRPELPITP
jgi:hypothetical protein